jgi:DNA (cytosine-5)-methyltransferase 1
MPEKIVDFKMGELFCGPGGIACGAKLAGFEHKGIRYQISHAWATDYDKETCETYKKNICPDSEDTVLHEDVRNLDLKRLKDISDIDGLAFGFPCNDFSIVGEQKGFGGTFGPLYTYGVELLKICRPKWFLAENVGGLSNSNEGKAFNKILSDLFDAGYSVYPHLYKFEEYGVPQARRRIIIIGIRDDLNICFRVPSPDLYSDVDVSVKTALTIPPIPADAPNQKRTNQSSSVVERLKMLPPDQNAWFLDELLQKDDASLVKFYKPLQIIHEKNPEVDFSNAESIRKKLNKVRLNVKSARMSQIYKRLHPAKPSYTITGSGGGGTHGYHWEEDRALTNRERARIQTFPDNFEFCGSKESVRKQIGMAVPCRGVQVIFEALLKSFAGISYEAVPCSFTPLIHEYHIDVYNTVSPNQQMIICEDSDK